MTPIAPSVSTRYRHGCMLAVSRTGIAFPLRNDATPMFVTKPCTARTVALLAIGCLLAFADTLEAQRRPARRTTTKAKATPDTAVLLAACGNGRAAACRTMSWLRMSGGVIVADTAAAIVLLEKGCRAGDARACGQTGWLLRQGKGVPADPARAATVYDVGCLAGDAKSCTSLGYLRETGSGVSIDVAQATTFYERGCKAGDPRGCSNLATVRDAAPEVMLSAGASSVSLLRAACTKNDAIACTNLGVFHESGRGVPANPARAVALYTRACQDHVLEACLNLGKMTALGVGVRAADPARAARLFTQACEGNIAVGCANLAVLQARGTGMPRDSARAKVLYAKACALGDTIACRRAQRP